MSFLIIFFEKNKSIHNILLNELEAVSESLNKVCSKSSFLLHFFVSTFKRLLPDITPNHCNHQPGSFQPLHHDDQSSITGYLQTAKFLEIEGAACFQSNS